MIGAVNIVQSSEIAITVPSDANLLLTTADMNAPAPVEPASRVDNDDSETATYTFCVNAKTRYLYRVSGDDYITLAGTVYAEDSEGLTISREMLEPAGKTRATIDRDPQSQCGANVADLYVNINTQGYLKMDAGDAYQFVGLRNWWATSQTWSLGGNYVWVQPDYHYTVLDMNGQPSDAVITVDENGLITAKGAGDAIVLVTYDSMNVKFSEVDCGNSYDGYDGNGFYGALWPENTGVFVVSVGAGESGIETGITHDSSSADRALDSEFDVIYFTGNSGEYTFTPLTSGVNVAVANPTVNDYDLSGTLSFSGFEAVAANADGSYTVPLTDGRNIVKVEKDGKAEYHVISAKKTGVTVNGMPLDNCGVVPGDKVVIKFDTLFNPENRNQYINSDAAAIYRSISGWPGRIAGSGRGAFGYYFFASNENKHTVENFLLETDDGTKYHNPMVVNDGPLTVPEDYTGATFELTNGGFDVGGFGSNLGKHRTAGGFISKTAALSVNGGEPAAQTELAPSQSEDLGKLPDISIPVVSLDHISVTTQPAKTLYSIGEPFDPAGMVVKVTYSNGASREITDYTCTELDSATPGQKTVTVSYTVGNDTKTTSLKVEVTDVELTGLEVTKLPDKTQYIPGQAFDPTGMEVTAVYSDGSKKTLADGLYTYTPEALTNESVKAAITVCYGNKTTAFDVDVLMITKFELIDPPNKTEYTVGERFQLTGMTIQLTWSDGTTTMQGQDTSYLIVSPTNRVLTAEDTCITVNVTNGIAGLQPIVIPITVGGGGEDLGEPITVYASYSDKGQVAVGVDDTPIYNVPVEVYDFDEDGEYTLFDAYFGLHKQYCPGGIASYDNSHIFWGKTDLRCYVQNGSGTSYSIKFSDEVKDGDQLAVYIYKDNAKFSDLYTWFDEAEYSAKAGERQAFAVNGICFDKGGDSSDTGDILAKPAGATVTVYDSSGVKVENLTATVDKDGYFALRFPSAGTYTVEVGGICNYSGYNNLNVTGATVVPSRCTVTVTGSTGGSNTSEPEYDSITVYMSYSDEGKIFTSEGTLLYNVPVTVYDEDKDGKYTMSNAFTAFHKEYYSGGAYGYADSAEGWVTRFWGKPSGSISYVHNHSWVFGSTEEIKDGDTIAAFNYKDIISYSDLYTWFDKTDYSVATGSSYTFTVNGLNVMNSSEDADATAAPAGATVTVYNGKGVKVADMSTTVDADGNFTIAFPTAGTYTVEVSGVSTYTCDGYDGSGVTYRNATVVPSRCTVTVGASGSGGGAAGTTVPGTAVPGASGTNSDDKTGFTDIPAGAYYVKAVEWAVQNGITTGTTKTTFSPDENCTRAQMVTFLWRAAGSPKAESAANPFIDIQPGSYYYDAVLWAVQQEITNGTTNTTFSPDEIVTRGQTVAFLYRYAGAGESGGAVNSFKDVTSGSYYYDAVLWAAQKGITTGTTATTFEPNANCDRAQIVTFLYRYAK